MYICMYVYIVGRRVRAEAVGAAVWRADGLTAKASKTQQWRLMPGTQSESLSLDTLVCGTSTTMHSFCESYSRASPWIHASSPERPAMFQSAVTANFRAAACAWTAGQVGWQADGRGTGLRALLEPVCGAHLRAALQRVAPVDLLHLREADRRGLTLNPSISSPFTLERSKALRTRLVRRPFIHLAWGECDCGSRQVKKSVISAAPPAAKRP